MPPSLFSVGVARAVQLLAVIVCSLGGVSPAHAAVQPQISAGGQTSLFLKPDGTVLMAGIHNYETSNGMSVASYTPNPLLTGAKKIAAGYAHNVMVKTNGSAWVFGTNTSGQLGDGTKEDRTAVPVQVMTQVSDVAAGDGHTLFLKTDGTVWATGSSHRGTLGDGTTTSRTSPVQVMTGAIAVATGSGHSLFLKADGTAWASGYNLYGQLGDGTTTDRSSPVPVLTDVVAISAGYSHSLFLKSDGSVWGTGANVEGQLGIADIFGRKAPALLMTGVTAISAGYHHSLFLKEDGSAWGTGINYQGQLGDGTQLSKHAPVKLLDDIVAISGGDDHSLFLKTDGTVLACGENDHGRLGAGRMERRLRPVQVMTDIRSISAGNSHTMFLKKGGVAWAAGANRFGQLGDGAQVQRSFSVPVLENVAAVATGEDHTLVLKTDGSAWGAGANYDGQLGPSGLYFFTADFVSILADVTAIAAGGDHNLFVRSDGSAWASGDNTYGQLGDGTTTDRHAPVQIMSGVSGVSASSSHSVFLKTDGTAWAAGLNTTGQLGDGTQAYQRLLPVQVLSGVKAVATSHSYTLFLKTDGSVWACGANSYGQFGDGSTTTRYAPVKVMSGGVAAIAAGAGHCLFLKTDGSVWAAGRNFSGELGDGTTTERERPVAVFSSASAISARGTYSVFLKTDGSAWATGENEDGQFGDGTAHLCLSTIQTGLALQMPQTIGFGALSAKLVNDSPVILSASADSGLPVIFELVSGPATLGPDGVTLTLTGQPGSVVVKASQPGGSADGVPYAAASIQRSFTVTKVPQSIFFTQPLPLLGIGAAPFALTATSSSGLPVSYLVTGPATVSEGQLVLTGSPGTVSITASQAGDSTYAATALTPRSFTVKAPTLRQTIIFTAPATKALVSAPILLVASSTSTLPVTLEIVSGPGVFADDNRTLTLTDTGTVVLRAIQAGNIDYLPASPVERVIIVPGKAQKITFAAPPPLTYGDAPRPLVATASSGLPVAFERVSGPAQIVGGVLTITGAGQLVVRAVQPGGSGFGPAPALTRTFMVNKAPLAVSFESTWRLVRQPIPVFIPQYNGFVNGDLPADLAATRPVGKTTATLTSPEGRYPITFIGGLDANYRFVPGEPAFFTVGGVGGSYEALLSHQGIYVGKLGLTVRREALVYTYSGTLTLVSEQSGIPIMGSLATAADFGSATGTFTRDIPGKPSLSLVFSLTRGNLSGNLARDGVEFGQLSDGFLVTDASKADPALGVGAYTMVFHSAGYATAEDNTPIPRGSGYATATIDAKGRLTVTGKLADGSPLTANLKVSANTDIEPRCVYRLLVNPYGKRLDSFFGGAIYLYRHEDSTRFPGLLRLRDETLTHYLVWQKAASPARPLDLSYREGFGPLIVEFKVDPWLRPAAKSATANNATVPAGTLAQRLGLVDSTTAVATVRVNYALSEDRDFGARAAFLPSSLNLSAAGSFTVPTPLPVAPDNPAFTLKVTPSTGAFSGSFVLSEQVTPPPAKPIDRKATVSGTLRQGPDGSASTLGHGHILLDPVPGDSGEKATEQVSGEFTLSTFDVE